MFASKDELFTRPSGGYTIARSVRLRSSASAYFNRTPATAGSSTKMTISLWAKRGILSASAFEIMTSGASGANDALRFTGVDALQLWFNGATYYVTSAAVFRDPAAWYHIVASIDTTQATDTNRMVLYVNGTKQVISASAYPAQNYTVPNLNKNQIQYIGYNTSGIYLDGYITEFNFIDGQALTPSSFGSTNAITGVWQPAKYTGTYGTNGFYLNFSDNSSNTATTIGKDYSGNGNNWTPNNISVTAGSTYDSMVDVPTLTSATAANYAVLNPLDVTNTGTRTIQAGNLDINTSSGAGGARSTFQLPTTGKWYFEGQYVSGTWSGNKGFGIGTSTSDISGSVVPTGCVTYNVNGNKTTSGAYSAYGSSYTTTDTVGIAVDQDAGTVTFYKNNTSQGAITHGLSVSNLFPLFVDPSSASSVQALNFGQRPFSYTPPTGFVALNTYNLPDSTIKNGAGYMAATTYTGTGAIQTISNSVNGISFQPDWVWIKRRDGAQSHQLYDVIRGVTKAVYSNLSLGEATEANGLSAFTSSGFTVISDIGVNTSSGTYVGWNWKASGTTSNITVSQYSSGVPSIASTVSVGATQGFSIVQFTASGVTATVGHGLGVAPQMIIVKDAASAGNWAVWHTSLTSTAYYLFMNTTAGQANTSAIWTGSPNLNTFGIGSWHTADRQIAYCFSAVAGYSAFGSYAGNNVADGSFVYLGFRPRFIMIKSTSASTEWVMIDTARSSYNLSETALYANREYSESTIGTVDDVDILSNGFKLRNNTGFVNASQTYIYAAFAENPFKNSLAR